MIEEIIDFHVHVFPEKIAAKAAAATGKYYSLPMRHAGTIAEALVEMKKASITRSVVHSTATRPEQVKAVNNFIAEACRNNPEFIGFGTLHPYMEGLEQEIERIQSIGLRGIKMHGDFQNFKIDESRAFNIYKAISGVMPVLLHMGDDKTDNTTPKRLTHIIERFPDLTVIGAHFGGYSVWDSAATLLAGSGIYVDISSSLEFITSERARELIDIFGADRCLFGTDFPMWNQTEELERFNKIKLTRSQRTQILWKNASSLLGLNL